LLEEVIKKIQGRLGDGVYPNEAAISFSIVMPILRNLGWDDSDPQQVMPEYSSGGRRVDFALCGTAKRPSLFIEVKGVGRVGEGDKQLFEYAFHEGIPLCLLTDGRDWSFYLPSGQGSYDDRRIYRLKLNERTPSECAEILKKYLDRTRIVNGDAFEEAIKDHRDIALKREASRNIPKAWESLVSGPEDLLVELLAEQTEVICGYRPSNSETINFLRDLSNGMRIANQGTAAPIHLNAPITVAIKMPSAAIQIPKIASARSQISGGGISFELFGKTHQLQSANAAFIAIMKEIADRYPNELSKIAAKAKGKSRNHIARTPEEIYPKRPDLARFAEIGSGWLVGLNIANREKMRIIEEACKVAGIRLGKDIIITMPNT